MTPGWVENLSDGPKIVHGPIFYINLEFETCGAGIWEKKINLGPSYVSIVLFFTTVHAIVAVVAVVDIASPGPTVSRLDVDKLML